MNGKLKNSFIFNLLLIILICIGFYYIFFTSLGFITNHGKETQVPDVMNQPLVAAEKHLKSFGFDVEVDSAYDPNKKPLIVLVQSPEVNTVVKNGRTIFLTVNKTSPPLTPMPKVQDLSYRSALMVLKSNKLKLGDTTQRPDYANGAILEQLYKGKLIAPGAMIPQGSKIDLVVGIGFGEIEIDVPDVIGMAAEEGIAILNGYGLTPIVIYDGIIYDSANAYIYNQIPAPYNELNAPNKIRAGDVVDIRVKENPDKDEMENNRRPSRTVIEDQDATNKKEETNTNADEE